MRLVVDANVVMAMLIALGSKARGILFAGKVEALKEKQSVLRIVSTSEVLTLMER